MLKVKSKFVEQLVITAVRGMKWSKKCNIFPLQFNREEVENCTEAAVGYIYKRNKMSVY